MYRNSPIALFEYTILGRSIDTLLCAFGWSPSETIWSITGNNLESICIVHIVQKCKNRLSPLRSPQLCISPPRRDQRMAPAYRTCCRRTTRNKPLRSRLSLAACQWGAHACCLSPKFSRLDLCSDGCSP